MPRVLFTSNLQSHVGAPETIVAAGTVADALFEALRDRDSLRTYVLDDQGRLRNHIAVFVDGRPVTDRAQLSDPVEEHGEVYVMQALSGG